MAKTAFLDFLLSVTPKIELKFEAPFMVAICKATLRPPRLTTIFSDRRSSPRKCEGNFRVFEAISIVSPCPPTLERLVNIFLLLRDVGRKSLVATCLFILLQLCREVFAFLRNWKPDRKASEMEQYHGASKTRMIFS